MKKLFTLFALLIGLSVSAQTNCTCDTASTDTNQILSPYSFHFDGYNNRSISFGDLNILDGGVWSNRQTIRILNTTQTAARVIWSKFAVTGNQRTVEFYINISNKFVFRASNNGTATAIAASNNAFTSTSWGYDVIWVYDKNGSTNANKVKLYVNGVKQALTFTGAFSTLYNSTTPLQIGIEGAGTALDQFNGFLNTYSFISDTISAIEADSLYNNGVPLLTESVCDNVILLPDFNTATFGGTNWTIPDSSGNGYNATTSLLDSCGRLEANPYKRNDPIVIFYPGQSNRLGNAANSGLGLEFKEKRADVKIWQGTSFVDLTTTTNTFPQINTGLHASEFATGWLLADWTGRDIYFVKYAYGGTSMYDYWKYGAYYYTNAVKAMDSVICYLESQGIEYDFVIDYNQGEHDAQTSTKANAYYGYHSKQVDSFYAHYPCTKAYHIVYTRSDLGTGFDYDTTIHRSQVQLVNYWNDPMRKGFDADGEQPGFLHMNASGYQRVGRNSVRYNYKYWFPK